VSHQRVLGRVRRKAIMVGPLDFPHCPETATVYLSSRSNLLLAKHAPRYVPAKGSL
jgi:hypothetical protein